jgi:hypothetical protein
MSPAAKLVFCAMLTVGTGCGRDAVISSKDADVDGNVHQAEAAADSGVSCILTLCDGAMISIHPGKSYAYGDGCNDCYCMLNPNDGTYSASCTGHPCNTFCPPGDAGSE